MTIDLAKQIAELPLEKRVLLFQQLQAQKLKSSGEPATIVRQSRESNKFPASFAQQRLWFLDQYEPDSPLYNIPHGFRMSGDLKPEILQRVLDAILERHEALRTTFTSEAGEPVQVIGEPGPAALEFVDLRRQAGTSVEREAEALRLATQSAQQAFDLAQGPVLRASLFQLEDTEYFFYINVHHIAFDGWSMGIFLRELAALYEAFAGGKPDPLPELPIQYADYSVWQRDWLQGEALEKQVAYWREQLAGVPFLELHTDRPRPAIRTPNGTLQSLLLPKRLANSLNALTQQEGATLFMTLLAAFQTLLHRYTGQDDISVGTLIANRHQAEIEGLIGFFANTLTLRTDLSGQPTFRELLRRVRQVALGAYDHQDLPFEKLVEALQPERDLSRTPLFQVMLILQNAPGGALELPGITLRSLSVDSRTAKCDLTFYLTEAEPGLYATLEYNTDLFDAATIKRMLGHFQVLLEGIVANPDQRLADLPLLTDAERQQLLTGWNATEAVYPEELCVHQLFEAQVARTPDAEAVVFIGDDGKVSGRLTYAELNERANQLAQHLQTLGVGPDTTVAIAVERSLDIPIALLATLKAGGAYVPLDPSYPSERLAYMLEDSQAKVLITQSRLLVAGSWSLVAGNQPPVTICLDTDWPTISQSAISNPQSTISPDNLAYIIYTSGSTGKPKGVQIPHRAVVNFLTTMRRQPGLSAKDILLSVTTISFDIAGLELFLPLTVGARLILVSQETTTDGIRLSEALVTSEVTTMQATPATWRLLMEAGWQGNQNLKILCGGEALPIELARQLLARAGELWNMYGPTEATIWSAVSQVKSGAVTIGHPIANTTIYILDPYMRPVPVGVPGELYLGGVGLARGYRHRPDMTAERFVPNPFIATEKAQGSRGKAQGLESLSLGPYALRLYRTGDLACYLPDGNIEFLGRIDHQVKVRGFRIELGEIETVLSQHPAVQQVAVLAREDTPGDTRLVAYVVADPVQAITANDLRNQVKDSLPGYMMPSVFIFLEAFPLTPNGKLDRRALPAPEISRPTIQTEFVEARTPAERTLTEIWREVLNAERVGINDNFFELGGDSLLVMRVVTKAKQAGIEITPKQLFQHQTVAELAEAAGKVRIVAEQGLVTGPVLMAPFQHYYFKIMKPKDMRYYTNAPVLISETGFNPDFVKQALQALLLHHDALRLRVVRVGEEWGLENAGPYETIPFREVDLSATPKEDHWKAEHQAFQEVMRALDMDKGVQLQVALIHFGPETPSHLMFVGHYLPLDIQSWNILLEDFTAAYEQLDRGDVIRLSPKTTSLQQWGQRLYEHAQSDEVAAELPYWLAEPKTRLPSLPVDHPEGQNIIGSIRTARAKLTAQETQTLVRLSKLADGFQTDELALTAMMQTLTRWADGSALLVDLIAHGREALFEDMDLSRTVGWVSTIFPVLLELERDVEGREAVRSIQTQLRQIPHNGVNYGLLRYSRNDAEIAQKLQARPKPEVYFNYMGLTAATLSRFRQIMMKGGYFFDVGPARPHLLQVTAAIQGDGALHLSWAYSENMHAATTMDRLVNEHLEAVRRLIKECVLGRTTEDG